MKFSNTEEQDHEGRSQTLIGPPDAVSNIRPIKLAIKAEGIESSSERRLRLLRAETQEFNQEFWLRHNSTFANSRQTFIKQTLAEKYPDAEADSEKRLSSDEMSEFYKSFLDDQWQKHRDYNFQWQKRNFAILALGIRVKLENLFKF